MKLGNRRINWRRFSFFLVFILIIFIGYNRVEALIAAGGGSLATPAPIHSPLPSENDQSEPDYNNAEPDLELPDLPEESASDDTYRPESPPVQTPPPSTPPSSEEPDTDQHSGEEESSSTGDSDGSNPDEANEPGREEEPAAQDGIKKVALTFDDGPDELWTPQILDILRQYDIEATFFLVGKQAEQYPDMLPVILEDGHEIANHTWSHKKLTEIRQEEVLQEIGLMEKYLEGQIGEFPNLFRAPYGALSDSVRSLVADQGYRIVGWTVDPRDWEGTTPEAMLEIVKSQLSGDGIILMHSFGGKNGDLSNTVQFLPILIDYLLDEGFTIVKASDIS